MTRRHLLVPNLAVVVGLAIFVLLVSPAPAEDPHDHAKSAPAEQDPHPHSGETGDDHDHGAHAGAEDHGTSEGTSEEASEGDDHDHRAHAEDSGHDEHGHGDERGDEHEGEAVVRLTPEELVEFGIEIEPAGAGIVERYLEIPGEVQPNADRLAHIVPRYSGIVTEVHVSVGDHVDKGQVLALVESDESLTTFEVRTLIPGTVIDKHITLGEAVSREGDAFVIADLSTVWIHLTVYQRDLDRVKVGQPAQIYVGHDLVQDHGTISYVTPIVDPHTRTATARVVLSNKDKSWRPGMFVTARVLIERVEAPVVVPETALHTLEDDTVVFVQTDEGFEPRPVTVGRRDAHHIEIKAGLAAGERYVSHGGFTLKAELGKGSFGHGHAH